MIFLIGYIVEAIVLYLWYRLIIKKELDEKTNSEKTILLRSVRLIIQHRMTIKKNIFSIVNYDLEQKQQIERLKQIISEQFTINLLICIYIISNPILLSMFCNTKRLSGCIFYIILVIAILINLLKEHTQKYIEALEIYIKYLLIPLEKNPQIIEINESETINVQWTTKNKIIAIIIGIFILFSYIIFSSLNDFINQYDMPKYLLSILIIAIILITFREKDTNPKNKNKSINFLNIEYELVKDQVEKICTRLKLDNVEFKIVEDQSINAFSNITKKGKGEVFVTDKFIQELSKMSVQYDNEEIKNIFLVTIGHELGHIFYKDKFLIKKRLSKSCIVNLILYLVSACLLLLIGRFIILACFGGIILLSNWLFGNIMSDKRYWGQIAEFKADRIAVSCANGGKDAFVNFWFSPKELDKEKTSTDKISKENIIYRYYKEQIETEEHPSKERRKYLLEHRGKWQWWEYFEHAIVIRIWRMKGLGWNGVLKIVKK